MNAMVRQECNVDNHMLSPDSANVAFTIAGYIAKKLKKRLSCDTCSNSLVESSTDCSYFLHLPRGGLTCPSVVLAELVYKRFALLDFHIPVLSVNLTCQLITEFMHAKTLLGQLSVFM